MGNYPAGKALTESLMGKIYLAKRDMGKAEEHFRKAVDLDPNLLEPYVSLARIYLSGHRVNDAIEEYENILKKNAKFLPAYMALGAIYEKQGKTEEARKHYRKALEIKKDFAPAANNLAWNLATKGGNIDEALGLAQTAKEQMPKNPGVMDTLGWIYYLKGSYLNAISELQDSLAYYSGNPVIHYHLGMAFFKNSQFGQAKKSLEEALKLSQDFDGSLEARKTLKEIENGAGTS